MKNIAIFIVVFLLTLQSCQTYKIGAKKQQRVENKVWIITGASSGLGRGIAEEAGRNKAKVILAARNKEKLEEIAVAIRKSGAKAIVVPTDIADSVAVKALLQQTLSNFGHIDVWVNNAGVTVFGRFWEVPLSEHNRVADVNFKGTMNATYFAMQQFVRQGYGKLINIASAESRLPTAYQGSYAATKSALKNLGIVIRQELRLANKKNITLVSVDPWALNTPIWDNAANYSGHAPRMSMIDRTSKAVNAVMHAATNNRNRDMAVGWKTHAAYTINRLFPRLSYRIASSLVHKHQMIDGPAAVDSSGNLYLPSRYNQVETDIKERIKMEKKNKK